MQLNTSVVSRTILIYFKVSSPVVLKLGKGLGVVFDVKKNVDRQGNVFKKYDETAEIAAAELRQ